VTAESILSAQRVTGDEGEKEHRLVVSVRLPLGALPATTSTSLLGSSSLPYVPAAAQTAHKNGRPRQGPVAITSSTASLASNRSWGGGACGGASRGRVGLR
jgi:hypothetical protein